MIAKQHSFGGSALDRLIFDYEAVLDDTGSGEAAPADAPDPEALEGADPVEDQPGDQPAAPAWSPEDPAFQEAVRLAVAEEATRLGHRPEAPPEQDGQVDLNEYLNPLSDEFGGNFSEYLAGRDQWLLARFQEMIDKPSRETAGQEAVNNLINSRWDAKTDGELTSEHTNTINLLAQSLAPEMNSRYGEGPIAAQQAYIKATEMVRSINTSARGAGSASNADQLAEIAAAAGEPGGGGGAINVAPPARTLGELHERRFGLSH